MLGVLLLIAPVTSTAAARAHTSPELERLLDLIEHRAALMPLVADYKRAHGLAIVDPEREAAVLDAAVEQAVAAGFEPRGIRAFFEQQILLARAIQQRRMQAPAVAPAADLRADLRPAISATGRAMLDQLALVLPLLAIGPDDLCPSLRARLTPLLAPAERIDALCAALTGIRAAPPVPEDRLRAILTSGRLRVGTTGDYRPFSYRQNGEPAGIDIDLAVALADGLDVELQWVQTSWPTLLEDLAADRFDIAMSGISRQPFRQRHGDFSVPYHAGGKTAISRCEDSARFVDLAAVDRPDVRVVVNPGGTNQRFVDAELRQAQIIVHPDNRSIFAEIAAGRADVMITDAIEVRLQSGLEPRLCPALSGSLLTFSEKGLLLPRDSAGAWLRYVNLWLEQLRGDGSLERIFARHLDAANR